MEELESSNGSIVGTIFVASCALVLSLSIALKHKREQYNRKSPLPQLRTNIHTMEFRDNSMPSDMHYKRGDRSKSLPYMRDTIFTVNEKAKQATLRERGITDSMTGNNKNGQGKDYARMHDKADEHRRLNYNYVCDFYYHSLLAQSHVRPQSAQLTEWQDETLGVSIPFSPILFSIASEERQAPLILLTFRYLRQEGHKITITIEKLAEPTSVEEYRDVSLSNISTCAEILSTSLARIGSAQRPQAEYCYTVDNEPNNSSISNSNNYTTMASSGTSALAHGISSTQSSHYYDSHNSMRTSEQQHMQNVHTNTCDHNNYMNNNINGYNNNSSSRTSQLAARSCKEQTRYALAVFVVFDTFAFTVQYVAPTRVRSILPTAFYELIRGIKVVDALPTTSYYLLTEPRLGLGIRLPLNFVITTNAMNLFYCDQNAAAEVGSKVKLLTGITRNEKEKSSQQQELKRYEENRREHVQLERQKKEMAKCAWSPLMIGASRGTSRIAFALKYEPPPHMKTAEEPSFTYTAQSALQHTIPWVQSSISRLSSSESESESESSSLESESTMSSTSFSSSSEQSQYSNYYSILEKYLTRQLYKSMNYFGLELLPSEECTCTSATSYARPVQTESKQKYQTSNTKSQIKPFTVAPDAEVSNNNNDDTIGIVALRRWPVSAVRKWNEITLAHGNKQNDSVLGNNNNNNRVASSFFFRRSVSNATVRQKECDNDKAVATSHNEYNNNSNNSNNAKKDCKRVESVTTNSQLQQEQEKEKIQELADEIQTKTQTAVAAVPSNGKQNTTTNLRINKKNYYNKVKSIRHNRTKFRVHVKRANDNNKNNNISYKVQNGFAMNTNNNGEAKERAMKETIQSDNTINIDARLYELSICKNGNFGAEYDDDDEYNNNNNDDSSNTYSVDLYKSMNGEVTHSQLHRSNSYAAHSSS